LQDIKHHLLQSLTVQSEIHSFKGSDDASSSYGEEDYGPSLVLGLDFLAGPSSPVPENAIVNEWFQQRDVQTDFVLADPTQR
jgi:hypothetical protein